MFPFRLYAATGVAVAQLDSLNWETWLPPSTSRVAA